jgi:hypothetical protein
MDRALHHAACDRLHRTQRMMLHTRVSVFVVLSFYRNSRPCRTDLQRSTAILRRPCQAGDVTKMAARTHVHRAWAAQTPASLDTQHAPCAGMADEYDSGAGLIQWLVQRGVKLSAAADFTKSYRCLNTSDAALFLRFELAPLHLANEDSVNEDMRRLLKCGPKVARRVIQDLDVLSAALCDVLRFKLLTVASIILCSCAPDC